jgi:anionic cell wall polymer biosynthesis LytR-Cps2A-Psr (LCP) family protein
MPEPTLAPSPTPLPTLAALNGRNVPAALVAEGATTGITTTTPFSLTEVPPPVPLVRLPEGTINIALLGIDTRPRRGGANTDVIIIASINPHAPAVTMLSIPRDTLVYIPNWKMGKVNTAFAHGGPELFKQTIKYNFGLNVDYFATVNFAGVVRAVETLGGIEVIATCPLYQVFPKDPYYFADAVTPLTVTVPYTDTFTGEVWQPGTLVPTQTIYIPRPGVYTLNGMQALAFARARYGVPGGDIDRGRRTQRVVRGLLNKARSADVLTQLPALLAQFQNNVKTDLTLDNILFLARQADKISDGVIRSRYFEGVGLTGANFSPVGSVLIPNRDNIQPYLQQALNVALNQLPNEGIPIEIWNGTQYEDLGVVAADRFKELGFNVVDIRPADQPYSKTTVIDFTTTQKGSAIPLLQRTFGIKNDHIVSQPNPDGPRYRIILGPDFNPCYYNSAPAARPTATPTPTPDPNAQQTPAPAQDQPPQQQPPPPAPEPTATASP